MYRIFYAERDTTIYERYPKQNTGIDQILELTKLASGSKLLYWLLLVKLSAISICLSKSNLLSSVLLLSFLIAWVVFLLYEDN